MQLQQTRDAQIQDLGRRIEELKAGFEQSQSEVATSALRLRRLEHWRRREASPDWSAQRSDAPSSVSPDIDYFLLGALYRNDRQMAPFLNDYDDVFAQLCQDQRDGRGPQGPVLDIGCGRGEFVAHLNEMGLSAYGIDVDIDTVEIGQEAQRPVSVDDAFAHLFALADNSLAAVTLIQVIEHFEFPDLVRLFRLVHRKLQEDGFILAETINPTSLLALSNWYLLDPSHRTPLHPQMTKFLLEQAEFEQVSIRFLHPVPEPGRLAPLPVAGNSPDLRPLVDRLNDNIRRLNEFLYGDQDYAAIAHKVTEISSSVEKTVQTKDEP
jgi:O-antigen chain-terminating methyltransferase